MASPAVAGRFEGANSTTVTTHTITFSSVSANDLLLLWFACTATTLSSSGWTFLLGGSNSAATHLGYKKAAGGETLVSFTSGAATRSAYLGYRITGNVDPATQAPELSTVGAAVSTTPDPPSLSPTGGSKDYLWLAVFRQNAIVTNDDAWITAIPTNYANKHGSSAGTAGTPAVGAADRQLTAATEDPGTFTSSSNTTWQAYCIAIHPAVSAPAFIPGNPTVVRQAVKRSAYFCMGEKWARKGKLWIPSPDRPLMV